MKTFDVYYKALNEEGELATFSYFIISSSWESAKAAIPPTHWISGQVLSVEDEDTGIKINLDNLN